MNDPYQLAHDAGVARVISLAEQTADIIAAEGDMAGARDPVTVAALRMLAQEAANLYRVESTITEEN